MGEERTRREFLKLAGLGTVGISLAGTIGCEAKENTQASGDAGSKPTSGQSGSQYVQSFRSRPDLSPPTIEVSTPPNNTAPGYIFIAPKEAEGQYGAMIADEQGRMVWFKPVDREGDYGMDCKVQTYKGEPVLTFWEGLVEGGSGAGEYLVLDRSYKEIARVRADGFEGDHHEFLITSRDTALILIFDEVGAD
ncbi:MAG: arylsulfotransferase family protein, partial [Rubrobacteraceae bacterium]